MTDSLDCLVVGGGPAGLTAALYLGRFRRRVRVIDAGTPRAAWIPTSHNIPFFADGIGGPDILRRHREAVEKYGVQVEAGTVRALARTEQGFAARLDGGETVAAHTVILATGSEDVEPDLPDLPHAVRNGLVRYCPICDGFEAAGGRIGVMGHGARGLGEALFVRRTYSRDVTLLTLGEILSEPDRRRAEEGGVQVIETGVERLVRDGDRIVALESGGETVAFETLYSALGLHCRTELATALGADHDDCGALVVDEHCQTSIPGLYAAGDIVQGLSQIVVGMGHAAKAATDVHNSLDRLRRAGKALPSLHPSAGA